jgi:hypothetical protein
LGKNLMANSAPWEKYQKQDGPWVKYQATEATEATEGSFGSSGLLKEKGKIALEGLKAVPDLLLTVGTSGAGEIAGGVTSAFALLMGSTFGAKDALGQAVGAGESVSDFITIGPLSESGRKSLEAIAPHLLKLERGVDDFSWKMSGGDPATATAIKTFLFGGLEILPAAKGSTSAFKLGRDITKKQKILEKLADDHGLSLKSDEFSESIIEAAKEMSPIERAENAPLLQEAIRLAESDARKAKDAAFNAAKRHRLFIEKNSMRQLSDHLRAELLEDGFDVDKMKAVDGILKDMKSEKFGFGKPKNIKGIAREATNFNQVELIRRRINKKILKTKKSRQSDLALNRIKHTIDDMIQSRFNDIAIAGDPQTISSWNRARAANASYMKRFKEDKVIADLVSKEASPEDIRKWVVGASKMNAKQGAAQTIKRLKEILGDNHPAIEGIRQDYIFELTSPLMKERPDFSTFARQYDELIKNNPSVVKELGLDRTALDDLRDFAIVQRDLPKGGKVFSKMDISSSIARLSVGHQIAKAGVRVLLARRIMNAMFGVEQVVSKHQILQDLIDVRFGSPVIPKSSPLAAQFAAGAALSGVSDEENK